MSQLKNVSRSCSSDEDRKASLNAGLFVIVRKRQLQDKDSKIKELEKCLNDGADINAKNQGGNTILHIAVRKGEDRLVQFLLDKGSKINVRNGDDKTPLDLAKGDQNLIQTLVKSTNVPTDGDCLFWAVTLAYLTPVKDNDVLFPERFEKLFGLESPTHLQKVKDDINQYNPFIGTQIIGSDGTFKKLVSLKFRNLVVDYMRDNETEFKTIVEGDSGCIFATYLDNMRNANVWGGEPEIKAMSEILKCSIQVHGASSSGHINGNNVIKLFHVNAADASNSKNSKHYEFGLDVNIVDVYQRALAPHPQSATLQGARPKKQHTVTDEGGSSNKEAKSITQQECQTENVVVVEPTQKVVSGRSEACFGKSEDDTVSAKRQFVDTLEIPSSGLKCSQHGIDFQLQLLMLFLWRAKNNNYASFRLATELSEAEKFDDVVFQYRPNENDQKWKYRLLQAKHKETVREEESEENKITEKDLLSVDDFNPFSLQKYFRSYIKIKLRSAESSIYSVFSDSEIEDIIVCTNTDFNNSDGLKDNFKEQDIDSDELLKVHKIQNKKWRKALVYMLHNQEKSSLAKKLMPIFEGTSDFYKLVEILAEHAVNKKNKKGKNFGQIENQPIIKDYYYALRRDVFIIAKENNEYFLKFQSRFLHGDKLNENEMKFRNALIKDILFRLEYNDKPLEIHLPVGFGERKLLGNNDTFKLAKILADAIKNDTELKLEELQDYHVELAQEVINTLNGNFFSKRNKFKKGTSAYELREFFKKEMSETPATNVTDDKLRSVKFKLPRGFGERSGLPGDEETLKKLSQELAAVIKNKKELKMQGVINDYHDALSREVIDVNNRKFHESFINGKSQDGKSIGQPSQNFRKIFLNDMIDIDDKNIKVSCSNLKNVKIKINRFAQIFRPEMRPQIQNVQQFAQQIGALISKSVNEKIIEVNANSIAKEDGTFKANINKLAGYVLIERFNKIRFSTRFLHSDHLPGNLNKFREELRKMLKDVNFESIYEYVFNIDDKLFKTCEDGALDRKLPILHNLSDVREFFSKLKFVVNYPNRKEVSELIGGEMKDTLKKLDSKDVHSLYQETLYKWMTDRIGTFYTVDKAEALFSDINNNLLFEMMEGATSSYFATTSGKYKFNKYSNITRYLADTEKQMLHVICQDLQLGRDRIVQTFKDLKRTDHSEIRQYVRGFGLMFTYLKQLASDENFSSDMLECFNNPIKGNLLVIECDSQEELLKCNEIISILGKFSHKKIILISQKEDDNLADKLKTATELKDKYEKIELASTFSDLTEDSQIMLLNREVKFQGKQIRLNKLIDRKEESSTQIMDAVTLVELIKNKDIRIGREPLRLCDLEGAYTRLYKDIPIANLINAFSKSSDNSTLFMITGISQPNTGTVKDELIKQLGLMGENNEGNANTVKNQVGLHRDVVGDKRIIVVLDQDKESNLKSYMQLCHDNPTKIIHWIEISGQHVRWLHVYDPNFYLKRKFNYQKNIAIKIEGIRTHLVSANPSDSFIFSDMDRDKFIEIFPGPMKLNKDDEHQFICNVNKCNGISLATSKENAEVKFQQLSKHDKPLHWLKIIETGDIPQVVWYRSHGSLDGLRKYIDEGNSKPLIWDEDTFTAEVKDRVVIIADEPGMGKSTTLTSLLEQIKLNWGIRIDLKDCHNAITKLKTKSGQQVLSLEEVVNFLLTLESSGFNTNLEKKLLMHKLLQTKSASKIGLQLLFDGFDEINDEDQGKVILLLQFLKEKTLATIWVTTRPYKMEHLENSLAVFATKFQEFGRSEESVDGEQEKYLKNFWQVKLSLSTSLEIKDYAIRLEQYTKSVLDKTAEVLGRKISSFMGIPLQLRLLAEYFQENLKTFIESETGNIPDFSILDLYQHFIKEKYNIYLKEKTTLDNYGEYIKNTLIGNFTKDHQRFALHVLFPDAEQLGVLVDELKSLTRKEEDNLKSIGIIQSLDSDGKPYFIHKTFAEYFVADMLVSLLDRKETNPSKYNSCTQFLLKEMFKDDNEVIRNFIDRLLAKDSPLHIAALNCNLSEISKRLNVSKSVEVTDGLSRTPLHLAAQVGSTDVIKALLETGHDDMKPDVLGRNPLHYAARYGNSKVIEYLLDYYADIDISDNIFNKPLHVDVEIGDSLFNKPEYAQSKLVKLVSEQDNEGKSSVYYAADNKHWTAVCALLLNGANCSVMNEDHKHKLLRFASGETHGAYLNHHALRPIVGLLSIQVPSAVHDYSEGYAYPRLLSYFFLYGHTKVIDALLKSIDDETKRKRIANKGDNSATPLDRVNTSTLFGDEDRLKVVKYLLENGITELQNVGKDIYITRILLYAAVNGHLSTLKYFLEQDKTYCNTCIRVASINNHLNIVEYIWQKYPRYTTDSSGNTALHSVADGGNLKAVRYLTENGAVVNSQNNTGKTPLNFAIEKGHINVVKYLIEEGRANVNLKNSFGETALEFAVNNKHSENIIEYLIKKSTTHVYWSPMVAFMSEFFRNPDTFNLNLEDKNGSPRLHQAILSNETEWAKFLVRHGAHVNSLDREGKTPLHRVAQPSLGCTYLDRKEMVELLLQRGAFYDVTDLTDKTPLESSRYSIWLLKLLDQLFHSQALMRDLKDTLLKERDEISHNSAPYLSWFPDIYDVSNPMLFILNARNSQKKTLLHVATGTNDLEAIKCLLQFNGDYLDLKQQGQFLHARDYLSMDINSKDYQGNTPLHLAAKNGYIEIVSLLLCEGAIFNAENKQHYTPEKLAKAKGHNSIVTMFQSRESLFHAVKQGDALTVKTYISKEYINAKDQSRKTPLHWAVEMGEVKIVKLLLRGGANIEAIDIHHRTPLHCAAEKDEILKLLLKNGAVFNTNDKQGKTPVELVKNQNGNLLTSVDKLFNNIQSDNPRAVIEDLHDVEKNGNILNVVNTRDNRGNMLLHYAAQEDYIDLVQYLLKNGAAYDVRNSRNKMPRDLSHHENITKLLKFIDQLFDWDTELMYSLKEIEEDPEKLTVIKNVRNSQGATILHHTKHLNYYRLKYLVGNGADVNAVDNNGESVLHKIAFSGKLDVVKWFVEHRADVNAVDNNDKTVLHRAAESGKVDLIKWLIEERHVQIDSKDKLGKTALHYSASMGSKDVIEFLLAKGVDITVKDKNRETALDLARKAGHTEILNLLFC